MCKPVLQTPHCKTREISDVVMQDQAPVPCASCGPRFSEACEIVGNTSEIFSRELQLRDGDTVDQRVGTLITSVRRAPTPWSLSLEPWQG
jgi:hypothetical protein